MLEDSDFSLVGTGLGYPTVVKLSGRLGSPINNWYLYCSPHSPSSGIYLATAASPDGAWTVYSSTPVITPPAGFTDISAPFVLWNPNTSELWLWAHCINTAGTQQHTLFWKSADGVTWTIQNAGSPVLAAAANDTTYADAYECGYLTVVPDGDGLIGAYQGVWPAASNSLAWACMTRTLNGVSWSRYNHVASPLHAAWDDSNTLTDTGSYRPVVIKTDGGIYVYYTYVDDAGTATRYVRRFLDSGGVSSTFADNMGLGSSGAWDDFKRATSDIVYHDGKFYSFYTGAASSAVTTEAIGVATATESDHGFVKTWGKG